MPADGAGALAGRGEARGVGDDHLHGPLVDGAHEAHVEGARARLRVSVANRPRVALAAGEIDAEAADGPEQELDKAFEVARVGLGMVVAAQEGAEHGDLRILPLDGDGKGMRRPFEKRFGPGVEGDKAGVQFRRATHRVFDAQVPHTSSLPW